MATRLGLYNEALRMLGSRALTSLSENQESRRVLDSVWDANALRYCLEQGLWNFAMHTVKLEYSPSVEPTFGYRRAFDKPVDFIRTAGLCCDEYFNTPLLQYTDEAGFIFTDLDVIYLRYVSDDLAYGMDTSMWPETFAKFVAAYMATEACVRITQSDSKLEGIAKTMKQRLLDARSKDAMAEATAFTPQGSWATARGGTGGWGRRGERGRG